MFAAVRAIAPVAGIPPNSADATFPAPCAASSMLERWFPLIIPSATTHERSDSIAAKIAMVNAFGSAFWITSRLSFGKWNDGRLLFIVYRSPIVFTWIGISFTIKIPTATAANDGGIFASTFTFGIKIRIARHTAPTKTACQFSVPIPAKNPSSFSIVSIVGIPAGIVTPQKSLSCPIAIVTAIPAVKPVVIVYGINLISEPKRQNPIKIKMIPARIVATAKPSIPWSATIPATIVANAAVGPAICTWLPPKKGITNPAITAV